MMGDLAQEQALSFAKVSNRDDLSKPLANWAAMRVRRGFDEIEEGNGGKVRPIQREKLPPSDNFGARVLSLFSTADASNYEWVKVSFLQMYDVITVFEIACSVEPSVHNKALIH